tara:strand:- start:368 stop:1228 length:861 start_codon:yes stop_codon:yes gene_type:complete
MSIDRPKSGELLTQDSIVKMHEEVRNAGNNIFEDNLGRSSIGPQHLRTTPELDFLPSSNTSFVMDFNETTLGSTTFIDDMISVPAAASQYGGLNYQNQAGLNTEVSTNWKSILTLTPATTTYGPDLEHDFSIIISFDSRVMNFTNSSKVAQDTIDQDGMIWYAVEVTLDKITSSTTTSTQVEQGSVVGCHLIDSTNWIKNDGTANSYALLSRKGGIEQSVSNTIRVPIQRLVTGGIATKYKIKLIKLYAAYTTCHVVSRTATSHTESALIGNTTLRYFVLKTPKIS